MPPARGPETLEAQRTMIRACVRRLGSGAAVADAMGISRRRLVYILSEIPHRGRARMAYAERHALQELYDQTEPDTCQ